MVQKEYLEAITKYNGYSATAAKILAELYRTAVNFQTTLNNKELAERLGLEYSNTSLCIRTLVKDKFLTAASESQKFRKYNISQNKLDELVAIYNAKNS